MAELALLIFVVSVLLLHSPVTRVWGAAGLLSITYLYPGFFVGLFVVGVVAYVLIQFFRRK